ncbi:bifunctional tetrahydrofolate synthase/dihydrofolate synthase [Vibrio gazogenes]|uniref:Dihydrofolate synthase/folylpolyglutamate synthase n=1 Tax=Vibrio gazogenes TaxID=687 RepID=A0A1Z2SHK2_VIBGA|nr:bifunctional tetrahydrofolate synthase/dihydrofolate synthase [Vibrio gazogenes]ASA56660.1 bifunctional tetrahydrofolate synthase/dihydrofolate synthase [Vibrio gazogenes]
MSQNAMPQATSPLSMWLDYLSSIHHSSIDLGLDRVQVVAQRANLLKPAPTIITVAGTNGKGSTCAIIEAILLAAGYSVGVYSSPHLICYNERVRINGKVLADEDHTRAFDFIEKQRGTTSLSFFEFGTLAALRLLQEEQVDVAILEVGLGGRLDATNVVDHDVSVITSLAIDHIDWLGDDLGPIGYEKAGIFRAGQPAVCGEPYPPATVAAYADEVDAEFFQIGIQFNYQVAEDVWHWQHGAFDLRDLPKPQLPLPNAATALMALGCAGLDISDMDIVEGLKSASLPGRMQLISQKPVIMLDVAHNPHSAQYLTSHIKQCFSGKKIHLVIGMLHDKDIQETITALSPAVDYWYPASLTGPRAAFASELNRYIPVASQTYESPVQAFKAAMTRAHENDAIIVAGSFHTVGEVLDFWHKRGV